MAFDPSTLAIAHRLGADPRAGAVDGWIGLRVPPGRDGFAPSLGLRWTGGRGSLFGHGWELEGLPSIGRWLREGLPRYDGHDRFALGGELLVPWLDERGRARVFEREDHRVEVLRTRVTRAGQRVERSTGASSCSRSRASARATTGSSRGASDRFVPSRTHRASIHAARSGSTSTATGARIWSSRPRVVLRSILAWARPASASRRTSRTRSSRSGRARARASISSSRT
ncbi:MAG: hypothetical protein IT378_16995 [Sandaracinaceae bacterium]|nr:hypothetical protein [Sandaracinaceae bacterium]